MGNVLEPPRVQELAKVHSVAKRNLKSMEDRIKSTGTDRHLKEACLERNRKRQAQLAGDLGDLQDFSCGERTNRQRVRVQLEEDEQRIDNLKKELEAIREARDLDEAEGTALALRLRRLQMMSTVLSLAGPNGQEFSERDCKRAWTRPDGALQFSRAPDDLKSQSSFGESVASALESEPASVHDNISSPYQHGYRRPSLLASRRPSEQAIQDWRVLDTMSVEAFDMVRASREEVESQLLAAATETVTLDREYAAFNGERTQLEEQLESLRKEHSNLRELHNFATEDLPTVQRKINDLRALLRSSEQRLDVASRNFNELVRSRRDAELSLQGRRLDRDYMRTFAIQEIEHAQTTWIETGALRERVKQEQELSQRELLKVAAAHSNCIASGGILFGNGGCGGPIDCPSSGSRSAVAKATFLGTAPLPPIQRALGMRGGTLGGVDVLGISVPLDSLRKHSASPRGTTPRTAAICG
jgi:septal ring factor EnvC (AmiA/AmiB activator)